MIRLPSTPRGLKIVLALFLLALVLWVSGIEAVAARLREFPFSSLVFILLLLAANLWLVSFRFWRVLAHFGIRVPWTVASRASLAGHVAGLVMISLFGQVMGRHAVMRSHGVSPAVNASLAGYERALLAITSGTFAVLGGIYLLGQNILAAFFQRIPLSAIVVLVLASAFLSLWLGSSTFEIRLARRLLSRENFLRGLSVIALTAVGQALVLGSFVFGILAFRPEMPVLPVIAASAIISFAASLPITINGWGVRELAAVFVLGKLGIPAAEATTVSVIVGVCSTAVILAATPFVFGKTSPSASASCPQTRAHLGDMEKTGGWLLGMAVALTIFFQFHAELPAGRISLNLADPFAILALSAVSLQALMAGRAPRWRVAQFNLALLLITLLLVLGFINGWMTIGVTQWALGARLAGWPVLLGYLSAGYLVVASAGMKGVRRLGETLVAAAAAIIVWQLVNRALYQYGWGGSPVPTPNFEGYSGNRNAFAFQLLVVCAWLVGYSGLYARGSDYLGSGPRKRRVAFLLGLLLAGVAWTGSRAGMLGAAIMLLAGVLSGLAERRMLAWAVALAALLWSGFWLADQGLSVSGGGLMQSPLSGTYSDQERWTTFSHALELWRQHPLTGAGLGVFIAQSPAWFGRPLVIHSTPLWILAEFGLLGVTLMGGIFLKLAGYAFSGDLRKSLPRRKVFLLVLLAFAIVSLFHELFYQRIFWLMTGALLALPSRDLPERSNGH